MLYVDRRAGSDKFFPVLRAHGVPTELDTLEFGDFYFLGNGPEGEKSVSIGVEHKRLDDLIKCMDDNRFIGHQLPGLKATYMMPVLMIEGIWNVDDEGFLLYLPFNGASRFKGMQRFTYGGRPRMYREIISHLNTLKYCAGIEIIRTNTYVESAATLANLYSWWNNKKFAEHRSHIGNHMVSAIIPTPIGTPLHLRVLRDMVMQLPGIGDKRSMEVMGHFGTAENMIMATVKDWMKIEGIGKETANKLVKALKGQAE